MKKLIEYTKVGELFIFQNALFVMAVTDYEEYPSQCLASDNENFETGCLYQLNDDEIVEIVSKETLKELLLRKE